MGRVKCQECGEPLTGRRKGTRYCGANCRVAAHRRRTQGWLMDGPPVESGPLPDLAGDPLLGPWRQDGKPTADVVEQLARAVIEARALRVQLSRLAQQLPTQLAYRARAVATAMELELDRNFGGQT